jgi:hypothetical protein
LDIIYSALYIQQKGNETRFSKLEKRKWKDTGVSAAFGGVMGFFAGLLKTNY